MGAGTRSLVPVELPAGVTLQWSFISEPKVVSEDCIACYYLLNCGESLNPFSVVLRLSLLQCVSFSVLHQPPSSSNQEPGETGSSLSQQRVLIPTRRVVSTQGSTVKGRLVTKQPGVYTLVFDNSSSR